MYPTETTEHQIRRSAIPNLTQEMLYGLKNEMQTNEITEVSIDQLLGNRTSPMQIQKVPIMKNLTGVVHDWKKKSAKGMLER